MTFAVRHEGSPRSADGLTAAEVVAGLADGRWEPTDEVRGSTENEWSPIELHPAFADAAAELEPVRVESDDETRLDMNPLIDVALVLLIFFILTTSYESIRRVLELPSPSEKTAAGVRRGSAEQFKPFTIRLELRPGPSVKLEDQSVLMSELAAKLAEYARLTKKRQLLLDARGVDWGTVVAVMDAAHAAGIEKTLLATTAVSAGPPQ